MDLDELNPQTLRDFNAAVVAAGWDDEQRKTLYRDACLAMWGRLKDVSQVTGDEWAMIWSEMVELDRQRGDE